MSKRKQTEEIPSKIKGMRRHNRSNGRAINRENVALRDGKWKVASPDSENGYILSELVYVLAIFTFFGLLLWVVIHFIAKFW